MTDESDDEGDGPPFPWLVRVAGLMIAAQGGLVAAAAVTAAVALVVAWRTGRGPPPAPGCICALFVGTVGGLVGLVGVDAARGYLPGVRWPGTALVACAVFPLAFAVLNAGTAVESRIVGLIGGLGVAVGTPGVLALAGARGYDAWRQHRYPES